MTHESRDIDAMLKERSKRKENKIVPQQWRTSGRRPAPTPVSFIAMYGLLLDYLVVHKHFMAMYGLLLDYLVVHEHFIAMYSLL